jgi:hypothetical protein
MFLLSDILTYIRRIIKSPSNSVITDNLLIDYVNRFYISEVDARIQLFDLKTKYQFQTSPAVDRYNMPLYSVQTEPGNQSIGMYPVYQGFTSPAYINGIQVPLQTQKNSFFNIWPNIVQNMSTVATGDGTANYTFTLPIGPNSGVPPNPPFNGIIRGHVDITGIMALQNTLALGNIDPPVVTSATALLSIPAVPVTSVDAAVFITAIDSTGATRVVSDSGQLLSGNVNYGLLMQPGAAPLGNLPLAGGYSTTLNTINYLTGEINVTFPTSIPTGNNINVQVFYFQSGLPRGILFYNNVLTLRSPPAQSYLVELDAYLSPAAFLATSDAIPFGYMAEYIARGAARKILSDTGDNDQFMFYEPLFREQEILVWKRSQRQITNNRTETIYSQGFNFGNGNSSLGGTSV